MKKSLVSFTTLLLVLTTSVAVNAQGINDEFCGPGGDGVGTQFCNEVAGAGDSVGNNSLLGPNGVLTTVAEALVAITAALSVIMIIVAGLMFIFGGSNPDSVRKARSTVLYAIIGLVIALVSQMIVVFILNKL